MPQIYIVPAALVTQPERLMLEETEIARSRNLRLKIRDKFHSKSGGVTLVIPSILNSVG